ncbi:hypothetical protein M413DRAFT_444505 [Hebeloma cylindrosporum]|uniref:Uncharacterized protein n=1 Tax=Hebeloma cylindrosporum TaxID=76867 RepID=A0A0C3CGX1_HEBCY|nr:hypothetical protein M413DRAFT_444505 [Hebeloma cylindrosporum h7]
MPGTFVVYVESHGPVEVHPTVRDEHLDVDAPPVMEVEEDEEEKFLYKPLAEIDAKSEESLREEADLDSEVFVYPDPECHPTPPHPEGAPTLGLDLPAPQSEPIPVFEDTTSQSGRRQKRRKKTRRRQKKKVAESSSQG